MKKLTDYESYLVHSYLYYDLDSPIIPDYDFDMLCVQLLKNYKKSKSKYKALVDEEDLRAGTGYRLTGKFPEEIKLLANNLLVETRRETK